MMTRVSCQLCLHLIHGENDGNASEEMEMDAGKTSAYDESEGAVPKSTDQFRTLVNFAVMSAIMFPRHWFPAMSMKQMLCRSFVAFGFSGNGFRWTQEQLKGSMAGEKGRTSKAGWWLRHQKVMSKWSIRMWRSVRWCPWRQFDPTIFVRWGPTELQTVMPWLEHSDFWNKRWAFEIVLNVYFPDRRWPRSLAPWNSSS